MRKLVDNKSYNLLKIKIFDKNALISITDLHIKAYDLYA